MKDVMTVAAASTIVLTVIEAMFADKRQLHTFLDNARYHHAKLIKARVARPECRIRLHFVPTYCSHLNQIERLWGLIYRFITHNKCYGTFKDFSTEMRTFRATTRQRSAHLP